MQCGCQNAQYSCLVVHKEIEIFKYIQILQLVKTLVVINYIVSLNETLSKKLNFVIGYFSYKCCFDPAMCKQINQNQGLVFE
jgi:hypothetical protein